jgi:hypothetical protein
LGENKSADKDSVRKLEGKRSLEGPSRRWNNIKIDVKELGGVCIGLMWLRIETSGGFL